MKGNLLISLLCLFALISCRKETEMPPEPPRVLKPVLPATPYNYSDLNYPEHFQTTVMNFLSSGNLVANPISDEGATLGRVLFYDKMLSVNGEKSCASCHHQEAGFTDPDRFSVGFEGQVTRRNSMALSNTIFMRRFFWDNRANSLTNQVLRPIEDPIEMGHDIDALILEMEKTDYYPGLFAAAFENDTITEEKIASALVQFINSMTAYTSKYDEGLENDFANFTDEEKLGRELFFERGLNCNQCHSNANFSSTDPRNNGLTADESDLGFEEVTGDEEDRYRFKIPSLRNVALTAPYMHDGRFANLREVIDHYDHGVQPYPNLDDRVTVEGMLGGTPYNLGLTDSEKDALESFMHTLTDEVLMVDERWSDPFQ